MLGMKLGPNNKLGLAKSLSLLNYLCIMYCQCIYRNYTFIIDHKPHGYLRFCLSCLFTGQKCKERVQDKRPKTSGCEDNTCTTLLIRSTLLKQQQVPLHTMHYYQYYDDHQGPTMFCGRFQRLDHQRKTQILFHIVNQSLLLLLHCLTRLLLWCMCMRVPFVDNQQQQIQRLETGLQELLPEQFFLLSARWVGRISDASLLYNLHCMITQEEAFVNYRTVCWFCSYRRTEHWGMHLERAAIANAGFSALQVFVLLVL